MGQGIGDLDLGLTIHNEIKSYLNIDESMYITKCMKIQHLDTRYRPKATWPSTLLLKASINCKASRKGREAAKKYTNIILGYIRKAL